MGYEKALNLGNVPSVGTMKTSQPQQGQSHTEGTHNKPLGREVAYLINAYFLFA